MLFTYLSNSTSALSGILLQGIGQIEGGFVLRAQSQFKYQSTIAKRNYAIDLWLNPEQYQLSGRCRATLTPT